MKITLLREHYQNRGFDDFTTTKAISTIKKMEEEFNSMGANLENVTVENIRKYIDNLIDNGNNHLESILAMARYFYLIRRNDIYVYFTSLLGGAGVIENIRDRMISISGSELTEEVFIKLSRPPLGTDPHEFPKFTAQFMNRIETILPIEQVKHTLSGNNHNIPKEKFITERSYLENAESLDAYLVDYHEREIQILQQHFNQGKVWFEQIITQEVIDFVKTNQEIMSGVRKGNKLFVTKIPYDPSNYLKTNDLRMKRYYACHCPFVRTAILDANCEISPNWCYCSAGFAKHPYEVLFDRELKVEMLQSALKGDLVCQFVIDLDGIAYK